MPIAHHIFILTLLFALSAGALAAEPSPAKAATQNHDLQTAKGMISLDYEVIAVPGIEDIDLLGIHYLHQLSPWLYLGFGAHAPLVYGEYGGFMAIDATLHARKNLTENWFVNAGASFGGGGGGLSVKQSIELSGTGGFLKTYAGVGYDFDSFSAGLNYASFEFKDSLINHSQLNLFLHKPVSFTTGSYASSGKEVPRDFDMQDSEENVLTMELNNFVQINPQGEKKGTIHALSLQYAHFYNEHQYLFFGTDIGYVEVPLYNQVIGGVGYRAELMPRLNLYSQFGIGSGGYAPTVIDTGPGLLLYPKVTAEYMVDNHLGLTLSGGYLVAPMASSKNATIGAAINYHPASAGSSKRYTGFRFHLFEQTQFDVNVGKKKHDNLNMVSIQLDNMLNDYWYMPTQVSVAYNAFLGYPGHGEALIGLGLQNQFRSGDSLQYFFQAMLGVNTHGMIFKPSVGLNYGQGDSLALYAQLGYTTSVNDYNLYQQKHRYSAGFAALGISYRFSIPSR